MSIPEPILVVYYELPKLIVTSELRQARVDESPNLRIGEHPTLALSINTQ